MPKRPRVHSPAFKAQVALAALKGDRTQSQVAAAFDVHVKLVQTWKKQLIEQIGSVFESAAGRKNLQSSEAETAELYEQIGRLKMELEWLKKKLPPCNKWKREQVEVGHPELSIRRQCELLGISRSSLQYEPREESVRNLDLMNRLDRLHLDQPWLGAGKLAVLLSQPEQPVNRKRIKRLMRKMGLECLFCRPKRQKPSREHRKYPNLVKGEIINRPCLVWSADITYIPMSKGFMYLAAVIDWYSRLVVSWQLSSSLDSLFCGWMLEASLQQGQPKIYHTDQGVQFTSEGWIRRVESANILVSMTHSGRYQENLFIERLWRSLKYENIYPNHYSSVHELEAGIADYIRYYNEVRPHQALEYLTPRQVHESAGIRV